MAQAWLRRSLRSRVRGLPDIQRDAGTHRRRHRQRSAVDALDTARPGAHQGINEGEQVITQLLGRETALADDGVDIRSAIVAEFDTPALELPNNRRQVFRGADDRTRLRVGHQAATAKDLAEATHLAHL